MTADDAFLVQVPKVDWNGHCTDMRSRLVTWQWRWKLPAGRNRVVLDFSKVAFMEPWAIAMFGAYALELRRLGLSTEARFDAGNPANLYQQNMGLGDLIATGSTGTVVEQWQGSKENTGLHLIPGNGDRRQAYAALRRFKNSAGHLALAHCPHAADVLAYAMDEIGRNVIQHSESPIGGVAIAQHFPADGRLQVAICDLGQGVHAHLRTRNPEIRTDIEALRLAILPHASGAAPSGPYGGEQNSGLGLFCSSELAHRSSGSLWIASGTALLGIRGDMGTTKPMQPAKVYRRVERWPGTIVAMDFPTATAQDLADVLKDCSRLATEARRLSGPSGLDFLDTTADVEATFTLEVREFDGDSETAIRRRRDDIVPRIERGDPVVIDFAGVRVPAQSFVHTLLAEAFAIPGSLVRLSFANCTPAARAVVELVAAYASYRRVTD